MTRMKDTIALMRKRYLKDVEDSPVVSLSDPMILHFMWGVAT